MLLLHQNTPYQAILTKYSTALADRYHLVLAANRGVNASAITDLIEISRFSKEFVAGLLSISTKTLDRYTKEEKTINSVESELVLKIMRLYLKGIEIFGELKAFNAWLEKPAFGMGDQLPKDFLNTSTGIDLIFEEIVRIEYGDLA